MSRPTLYELLPSLYRRRDQELPRDADEAPTLEALFSILQTQYDLLEDDIADLEMPADHNLCWRFSVLRRDADDGGIAQQGPATERTPGFRPDPMLVVKRPQGPLLKPRMKLDLIDRGRDPRLSDDALKVLPIEIRYSDRLAAAFAL